MKIKFDKKYCILALGAESVGIFAVYKDGNIFISENFGDLLNEDNFLKYKKAVLNYLKKEKIKPDIVLTDLHPLYKTTILGEELARKHKAENIKVQHHIAHIFSAVGDMLLLKTKNYKLKSSFFGIAMDGTGYGLDGNIWGGEAFRIQIPNPNFQFSNKPQIPISKIGIQRIGSLEEQIMIGGDLAVREPARMLIAILAKITNYKLQITHKTQNTNPKQILNSKNQKDFIYEFVKKFYTKNEFGALYNQMEQDFNCQKTTSTARILDAVAILLGFAGNGRKYKHEATKLLEENSSKPYTDLKPQIFFSVIASSPSAGGERGNPADIAINTRLLRRYAPRNDKRWILQTTHLFEYLIKNIHKDKKRLAATAQLYIARGLYELAMDKEIRKSKFINHKSCIFAAGGLSNNKIISAYLEKHGVCLSKKIPRGDEGIAFGQIVYYLTYSWHEFSSRHFNRPQAAGLGI